MAFRSDYAKIYAQIGLAEVPKGPDDGKNKDGKNEDGKNKYGKNEDGKNKDGKNKDGKNKDGKNNKSKKREVPDEEYTQSIDNLSYRRPSSRTKVPLCDDCGIEMTKNHAEYICDGCGRVGESDDGDVGVAEHNSPEGMSDYNTSDNSAAPVSVSGPGSYQYQKRLICCSSNYKKQQHKNTSDQMSSIVHQYQGPKPSDKIIGEAVELYYQLQQYCIKRGNVRKGTMAACLYRKCKDNNVTRKPKEIAKIFKIDQKDFSNGEKILNSLIADGLLSDSNATAPEQFYFREEKDMESYLSSYFEKLNITEQYREFCSRLIRFTIKYRIAESSVISSKCAGSIYILSTKMPELGIGRDVIAKECDISKSTFSRFHQSVFAFLKSSDPKYAKPRSRLRRVFKKAGVPYI